MSKMSLKAGLGLLVITSMTGSFAAAAPAEKSLPGHVPAVVSHLAKTGELAATNDVHLAIGLELRNQAALDDLFRQVSDPASSNYRHYLTPGEFTTQFAPTEADYAAVIAFAKAQGLAVTATTSNRMLVQVTGKADAVEKAFKVSLHTYNHPTEHRTFFAPDSEPTVPANLVIADISGLNNYARPKTSLRTRPNDAKANAAKPAAGSGPDGTYMGNDFRAAYLPGATQTGAGQKVALVQFDGYFASDIQEYETLNNLPNVSLTNILLNGFSGNPTLTGGEVEVSLDIEMVISMAYGVDQVRVYEGDPVNFLPNVVLNQIASDDAANQVSSSWSWGGGPSTTSDQIFKEMALQGQTYFTAVGDYDAFLPGEVNDPSLPFFPCGDPYVISVGGTTLTTTGPGGAYVSETVWNWDVEYGPSNDGIGTCGGISSAYAIPWWQTNVNMTANHGSTLYRNVPDVALTADNVLVIADDGNESNNGGTSCATPLWAAFTALVNQQGASLGRAPLGFLNPALYALGNSKNYTNVFRDTTTGSNTWSSSPTNFIAVVNYDLCTGLGTPNGTNLINALTSTNTTVVTVAGLIPPPSQPWSTNLSVMNGSDPNGFWLLYIQDDTTNTLSGTNYNGWMVNLTSANPVGQAADNQLYVNTTIGGTVYGNATNVVGLVGALWHTTLAVTNYGPSLSSNVYVSDTLPPAASVPLVSTNYTVGVITNFGSSLVWSVGNLASGTGTALTLSFQLGVTGIYTNSATVGASTTDPNPDDDNVSVIATVSGQAVPPILLPNFSMIGKHMFQLSVTNDAGSTIIIQASTNLISWLPISTNVSPFTFTNYDSTNYQQRFYRAQVGQ